MSEKLKIALLRVLASLSFLTIGMIANTIFEIVGNDDVAYNVFTISWSASLFFIVWSLVPITKPITYIYRGYLMFLCLSFTNLCNAIAFSASKVNMPLIWFSIGFVLYSGVLINEAIIKSRK